MSSDTSTFLIVGLGNPGDKYALTRHNVGFWVLDRLAEKWGAKFSSKFKGLFAESKHSGKKIFLLKPQTYMNLSGESVEQLVSFYKLTPKTDVLVISDDLDLPPAQLRLRLAGGSGGHNGLISVMSCLGTEDFARLRMGIGRSTTVPGEDYVLTKIPKAEWPLYREAVESAVEGIEKILSEGLEKAMNSINQKREHGT